MVKVRVRTPISEETRRSNVRLAVECDFYMTLSYTCGRGGGHTALTAPFSSCEWLKRDSPHRTSHYYRHRALSATHGVCCTRNVHTIVGDGGYSKRQRLLYGRSGRVSSVHTHLRCVGRSQTETLCESKPPTSDTTSLRLQHHPEACGGRPTLDLRFASHNM